MVERCMEALEAILTRSTVPPVKMAEPGPDTAARRRILEAAAAAPDHGRLRPWRFLMVEGEGRVRLGELFAAAIRASGEPVSDMEMEKQRTSPLRAPLIIVVVTRLHRQQTKIPDVEQVASAAAAAQNMLIAAHALGFAAKWTTGRNAYDPIVREGLGLSPDEAILGFVFIGSPAGAVAQTERPPIDDLVASWPPT
jgi:nitroreductase